MEKMLNFTQPKVTGDAEQPTTTLVINQVPSEIAYDILVNRQNFKNPEELKKQIDAARGINISYENLFKLLAPIFYTDIMPIAKGLDQSVYYPNKQETFSRPTPIPVEADIFDYPSPTPDINVDCSSQNNLPFELEEGRTR